VTQLRARGQGCGACLRGGAQRHHLGRCQRLSRVPFGNYFSKVLYGGFFFCGLSAVIFGRCLPRVSLVKHFSKVFYIGALDDVTLYDDVTLCMMM
jgi:hypothetical protein